MVGTEYYRQLINDSCLRIKAYEQQVSGLEGFLQESKKGAEQFCAVTTQRRRNLLNNISGRILRHPMVSRLNVRLTEVISSTYEDNILNNFHNVNEEIQAAILRLENRIEDEKSNITIYESKIKDIEEENHTR